MILSLKTSMLNSVKEKINSDEPLHVIVIWKSSGWTLTYELYVLALTLKVITDSVIPMKEVFMILTIEDGSFSFVAADGSRTPSLLTSIIS